MTSKQLQWYGHVQGMDKGRLPKKTMKCQPKVQKMRGRLKLRLGRQE